MQASVCNGGIQIFQFYLKGKMEPNKDEHICHIHPYLLALSRRTNIYMNLEEQPYYRILKC